MRQCCEGDTRRIEVSSATTAAMSACLPSISALNNEYDPGRRAVVAAAVKRHAGLNKDMSEGISPDVVNLQTGSSIDWLAATRDEKEATEESENDESE